MSRTAPSTPRPAGRPPKPPTGHAPSQLAELARRFARFREEHPRGTRVPDDLRTATLAAVNSGIAPGDLQRSCGVTSTQLRAWKAGTRAAAAVPTRSSEPDVRVFSVVDEPAGQRDLMPTDSTAHELELRLGPWSLRVRLAPHADPRG